LLPTFLGLCLSAAAPAAAQAQAPTPSQAAAPAAAQPAAPTLGQPSREPSIAPAPDWLEATAVPAANPAMRDRPIQTLLASFQTLYAADRQDNYTELAFLIQNAQGLQGLGNINLPWQPDQSELIIHKAQIIRNGVVIDLLAGGHPFTVLRRENNLESATLDGVLTAVMQPEGLAVGDILTLAFTVRQHGGALPQRGESFYYLRYGEPVRHFYVRQIWPGGIPIRWRGTGVMEQARTRTTRRGTELVLDLSDVEGPQPPTLAPARMAVPTALQVSQYRDWAEVSATLAPHFQRAEQLAPASPLRAEIARIAASTADPRQRAMAALRLVEDQVRYLALTMGDGNYLPATADETWSRRYADCKGKTVALLALLHGLGIEAEPVLVNALIGDSLSERLPGLSVFNHVIVRARIGGHSYWLDGTRSGDRNLDDLASSTFAWGLPLRAAGSGLEALPYAPPAQPLIEVATTYDGSAGLQGILPVRVERIIRGELAAAMRLSLSQAGRDAFIRQIREDHSSLPGENGVVGGVDLRDDPETGVLTVIITGRTRMRWTGAPGSSAQQFRFDNSVTSWDVNFDRPAGPFHDAPFAFQVPNYLASTETVILPHGGEGFAADGRDFDHVVAGMRIRRQVSMSNGRVTVRSEFRKLEREVSAESARASTALIAAMRDDQAYLRGQVGPVTQAELLPGPNAAPAARPGGRAAPDPTTAQEFVDRGYARLQSGAVEEAAADFDHAGTLNPRWARPLAYRAITSIQRGNQEEAEALLARAAQLDPNDFILHQGRGLVQAARNRPIQAIVEFSRTLELEPGNEFTLLQRAAAFAQVGELDDALTDLGAILSRSPHNLQALGARARLRAWQGEYELALADADAMVAADPHDPIHLYRRAGILRRMGRADAAATAYAAALAAVDARVAASPNQADDYDGVREVILSESGQTARAIALVDAQLARHADDPHLLNERCWTRATANIELPLALADCEQAVARAPDNSAILDSRAFVKLRMGQYDGAIADEDAALAHIPNHPAALYTRGIARLRKGEREAGERDLAAARRLVFDIDATYRAYGVTP
jgi:tetratricopeptide (TPR) repeat protein